MPFSSSSYQNQTKHTKISHILNQISHISPEPWWCPEHSSHFVLVWMRCVFHNLELLSTWSPLGDLYLGRLGMSGLPGESMFLGLGFEIFKNHTSFPVHSLWFLLVVQDVSSQLLLRLPCSHSTIMDPNSLEPGTKTNSLFCKFPWPWCLITATEN